MALWRASTPHNWESAAPLLGALEGYLSWIICHVAEYPAEHVQLSEGEAKKKLRTFNSLIYIYIPEPPIGTQKCVPFVFRPFAKNVLV